MRSINTSLIALLPVAGLLFVGAGLLGVGTSRTWRWSLFVGLATGAYSSIFLATPLRGATSRSASRSTRRWPSGSRSAAQAGPRPPRRLPSRRRDRRRPRRRPATTPPPSDAVAVGADGDADRRRPATSTPAPAAEPPGAGPASSTPRPCRPQAPPLSARRRVGRASVTDRPARAAAPRRARLPDAGRAVQGHHPAAGRPGRPSRRCVDALADAARRRPGRPGRRGRGPRVHARRAGRRARSAPACVPVRKAGKLPPPTVRAATSWSTARPSSRCTRTRSPTGERVLLVDDVLATGGTAGGRRRPASAGPAATVVGARRAGRAGLPGRPGPAGRARPVDAAAHRVASAAPALRRSATAVVRARGASDLAVRSGP